ncbi:MAG: hypothetical protein ABIX00_04450 [Polaromonas sp.]
MFSGRRHRLITVLLALCSFLFMQLAVASYVCPDAAPSVAEAAVMVQAGMPCAAAMSRNRDDAQPNLCKAHCQAGHQTTDKYQPTSPVAIDALPADFRLPCLVRVFLGASLQAPHLTRTTAPPLAIRNCCFRI